MTKVVVVTSGKGGVGKTTTSASFATGLAKRGRKTAVIDFDIGLRNLDLILGCERRVVYDFVNVIQGDAKLSQALVRDKHSENLSILAASQTKDKESLKEDGVKAVLDELKDMGFEFIICDSPAGIESGALMALRFADEALVVTNPEVSAVRDADRMLGLIEAKSMRAEQGLDRVKEHLVITRYAPQRADKGEMLAHTDVAELLSLSILGLIPESEQVLDCSNQGLPVILANGSPVALAYDDMVARFLGEDRPLRFIQPESAPLWKRLFGG
ncbi:MAG TPA: septum site-determining protein MinD [Burkholderiales bacterium]|nr:septum site-determining protein MinD [Burkholderiales bacterium]